MTVSTQSQLRKRHYSWRDEKKEGTADCTIGVYGKINRHEDLQLSLKER